MADVLSVTDMIPNQFEPKKTNQWIFALEGIDAFLMKSAARPSVSFAEIRIDWINTKRYIAVKPTFGTIASVFHDPIAP